LKSDSNDEITRWLAPLIAVVQSTAEQSLVAL